MIRKIGVILIALFMAASLAVQPAQVFGASSDYSGESFAGQGTPAAEADENGASDTLPIKSTVPVIEDVIEPEADAAEEEEAAAYALGEIEALTIEAGEGALFDGYIVKIADGEVTDEMIGAAPEEPFADGLFIVDTPEEALDFADPGQIEVIEPNYIMTAFGFPQTAPDDPGYGSQWYLKDNGSAVYSGVRAEGMWLRGMNGEGVSVAVLDTGINAAHRDMGRVAKGYNFTGRQGKLMGNNVPDARGHGTIVSSIIAAKTNNGLNIAGLAYEAEIVPFKILDDDGRGSMADVMAALNYIAINNDALKIGVVNMSLGTYMEQPSPLLQQSVDELLELGVILVAAAGNGYTPTGSGVTDYTCLMYPAACDGVIGVASVGENGVRSSFSQRNDSVDVAAPGERMYGLSNTDTVNTSGSGQGTSYAAPLVASVAAAVKQIDPDAGYEEFIEALADTSTPKGEGKTSDYGFGLLNAEKIAAEYIANYSVRYFYDGVQDPGLTESLFTGKGGLAAPAPGLFTNARIGYMFAGYYLNGEPVPVGSFPVGISEGGVIDVCYVSRGLNYEDREWYFYEFDEEGETGGRLTFGWVEDEGGYRYFNPESGKMAIGLVTVPGVPGKEYSHVARKCFFDSSTGYAVRGLVRIGGYDYYFDCDEGMVTNAEVMIDKRTGLKTETKELPYTTVYRFDVNGRAASGWFPSTAKREYYYDKDGRAEGAKKIDGYFYYFDPQLQGLMRTTVGLINDTASGNHYYCYSDKGYLRVGKFTAKLSGSVTTTLYADKATAALLVGEVKDGSAYYWYEGPQGLVKNVERSEGGVTWFYGSDGKRKSGWVTFSTDAMAAGTDGHVKGDKVYYDKNKGLLTGAQKIGSYWYFLMPWKSGAMWDRVGEVKDDSDPGNVIPYHYYCYSVKGYLKVGGEQSIDGQKYYFDKNGRLAEGPHKVGSYIFYYVNGLRQIPAESEWLEDDAGLYYITAPLGRLKTGKFTAPAPGKAGAPKEGAQLYLDTATGAAYTGRVKLGGAHYYYDGRNGLVTEAGWIYGAGGEKLHYVTGINGRLKTGELKPSEYAGAPAGGCYFSPADAKLFTGQVKIGSQFYYYEGEAGRVLGDERAVPDKNGIGRVHYYREGDGRRVTGWVTHAGEAQKGVTVTSALPMAGSYKAGDKVYYHSANGLLKGKHKIGAYWYWFDKETGALWTKQGTMDEPFITDTDEGTGKTSYYHCYSQNGYLKTNGWLHDLVVRDDYGYERKCSYYFDKNGARAAGPVKIGSLIYFFDRQTGALVKTDGYYIDRQTGELKQLDGKTPVWIADGANRYCTTGKDGRLLTGSHTVDGKLYFFDTAGALCVNIEMKISSKWYFFDEYGERLSSAWLDLPDGRQVYYGSDGARYSGVQKVAVLDTDGNVFRDVDNKTYEFWYSFDTATGAKMTGWLVINKKTYYYDPQRPAAEDIGAGKDGAIAVLIPGARAHGEVLAEGNPVYLDPVTGELFTGQKQKGEHFFYYDGKNGMLFGDEKKIGSFTYYYRAADEEEGYSYVEGGTVLKTGFLGDPVPGPAGSRVKGWWKVPAKLGGDFKYYSDEAGILGRMQVGKQTLPKYYAEPYDTKNKAEFFLHGSTGLIRRGDSGVFNGFAWITNERGEVLSWEHIGNILKGVDVSYWQGTNINWAQVRNSGVKVAIARAGYNGRAGNTAFYTDSTFIRNIEEAKKNGIYVGAYIYVYSCRTSDLNTAIDQFASWMKTQGMGPRSLDLPVFLDIEDAENRSSTSNNYATLTNAIRAGMKRLESHGYNAGYYSNLSWANNYYDANTLFNEGYSFWLASWGNNQTEQSSGIAAWNGMYPSVWQYRSTGSVPGISGRVDMNYIYSGRVKWT